MALPMGHLFVRFDFATSGAFAERDGQMVFSGCHATNIEFICCASFGQFSPSV
jgi:hypothetical protein